MYFTKFYIQTARQQAENIKKIEQILCTDKLPWFSFNFDYKNKPFIGSISDNKFKIIPVIDGRNSFVPVIIGEISNDDQSIITIKMRLHYSIMFILLFMTLTFLLLFILDNNYSSIFILSITFLYTIYESFKQIKKYKTEISKYLE